MTLSELRKDPIVDRWVIVAPERGTRPSDFSVTPAVPRRGFCPLCVGNESRTPPEIFALRRPDSHPNRPGWDVRVVPNKFPALEITGDAARSHVGIYESMPGVGAHEVVVESPDHDWRMHFASNAELGAVISAYRQRILDLQNDRRFLYLMLFRNYGEVAGASLTHPHSQLIALPIVPKIVKEELLGAREYYAAHSSCIFCDMLAQELSEGVRIVCENESFVAFCPYASRFSFEVTILPKRHSHEFATIAGEDVTAFAALLRDALARIFRALGDPPYNLTIHSSPNRQSQAGAADQWQTLHLDYHWHVEIMPRLTRVAGFEWGTGFYINPIVPEKAARILREAI